MTHKELKPCPFCGKSDIDCPTVNEIYGTTVDLYCNNCGIGSLSLQVCDVITREERNNDTSDYHKDGYCYSLENRQKTLDEVVKDWNTRPIEDELKQEIKELQDGVKWT